MRLARASQAFLVQMGSAHWASVELWDAPTPQPVQGSPFTQRDSTPHGGPRRDLQLCLGEGRAGLALHFPVSVCSASRALLSVWGCGWHRGCEPLRHQFTRVRVAGDQGRPPSQCGADRGADPAGENPVSLASRGSFWAEPWSRCFPSKPGNARQSLGPPPRRARRWAARAAPPQLLLVCVAGTASGRFTSTSSEPCWGRIGSSFQERR